MTGVRMRILAGLLVFVAVWMPGAVRADWTEWLLGNERVVQALMPDAGYVFGAATRAALTYGGGVEWMPGDWWGLGLEYRQAQVRQARGRRGTAHAVGVKTYAETPAVWRVSLRPESTRSSRLSRQALRILWGGPEKNTPEIKTFVSTTTFISGLGQGQLLGQRQFSSFRKRALAVGP